MPVFFALFVLTKAIGQSDRAFADSLRTRFGIPELAYAVVSADSIIEMQISGVHRNNTEQIASLNDRFRIGSLTKTVTSYIAAVLVKQGKIQWNTKFFDLYPELKNRSDSGYYNLTLLDLITFRANLISWSYDNTTPTKKKISGDARQQRYLFTEWVLRQKPFSGNRTLFWSNPSYVAAGLMLEKATVKPYESLVAELGQVLDINFGFGQPNLLDENQPWGHDEHLKPEIPANNYKLNWLSSAGNINVSLPDYCRFIQMQLRGLLGRSELLTAEDFANMHFGKPEFAYGWKWYVDDKTNMKVSYHEGNPGTFLSKVFICHNSKKAFILFANVQSQKADQGLKLLLDQLMAKYSN